ncbi:MAG: hypothetical protein ACOYI5_06115 [Christensenellales bacterium]|jgi:ABC-type transport system involved in cytochrome bd biosynthesis fused ATPase/permease subunit
MELDYTWASLGTTAGCAAAVLLVTQYIKDYTPRWLPTRLLALVLSFLFLLCAWGFGANARSAADIPLIAVNAFPVALAAMGAYETALKDKTAQAQ